MDLDRRGGWIASVTTDRRLRVRNEEHSARPHAQGAEPPRCDGNCRRRSASRRAADAVRGRRLQAEERLKRLQRWLAEQHIERLTLNGESGASSAPPQGNSYLAAR